MVMYIITHKKFEQAYPKGYRRLLVGAQTKNGSYLGYLKDNQGENISEKNKNYCELTGLYWMWKNVEDQKIGLSHYRRYFKSEKNNSIITIKELDKLLDRYDWIVATPWKLGYWHFRKNSVLNQYRLNHNIKDMNVVREVICEKYPDYICDFDYVMNSDNMSPYNMFYTNRKNMDEYCSWLFDILFEVDGRIDISDYDSYQARVYGFLSERLFNVYLRHRKYNIKYLDVINTECNNQQLSLLGRVARIVKWH